MTHRDGFPRLSASTRVAWRCGTSSRLSDARTDSPAAGSPARPERRFPKAFGRPMALRRGAWLAMPRIAAPRAPGRKPWETVSMSHCQRSLVLDGLARRTAPFSSQAVGLLRNKGPAARTGPVFMGIEIFASQMRLPGVFTFHNAPTWRLNL